MPDTRRNLLCLIQLCSMWITMLAAAAAASEKPHDPASGQAEPTDTIVTDRPDVAESSETVGALRFQLEAGLLALTEKHDGQRTSSLRTPTKLRFGVIDPLEIHVETAGFAWDDVSGGADGSQSHTGVGDFEFGFKAHLCDQQGFIPSTGLLFGLMTPLGSGRFTDSSYRLRPTFAFDWDLTEAWAVGSNFGFTVPLDDRDRASDLFRFALAVGRTWSPLLPTLRTYVEIFNFTAFDDGETELAVDGGFTWLVRPNLQLDLTMLVGITGSAADIGGGLGASIKL